MKKSFLSLFFSLVAISLLGCGLIKKEDAVTSGSGSGGSVVGTKLLANNWSLGPWGIALGGIPTNDTVSNGQYVYADNSVCNCDFRFNGSNSAGAYKILNCVANPTSGKMASPSNCSALESTTSYGTYTNDGTSLVICRNVGSCLTYN
ncbi:MAG: hypothetical protein EOP11_08670 [Proteobacteria bacterium]|nr:MAG: hypothetical protein EOP11_08670 [Pseudomonadota bacterium]